MRLLPRFKKPRVDQLVEILCLGLAAFIIVKMINNPHPSILGMPLPAMPIIHDFGSQLAKSLAPLQPLGRHLVTVLQHPPVHPVSHSHH